MSDPEQALHLYRRGYDLLVAAHGEGDGDAAVLLQNIGRIHSRAGRFQDAKDAYERALPVLRRHFGERDPHGLSKSTPPFPAPIIRTSASIG
jgi:hypothetical protein